MKIWFITSFLIFYILLLSCEQDKVVLEGEVAFEVKELNVPEVISTTSDRSVLLTCRVNHPDGDRGIAKVVMQFSDSLGNEKLHVPMYDDGDAGNTGSGDVIAFDHIFSATLKGNQLALPQGEYNVDVIAEAVNGDTRQTPSQYIRLFPNQPPVILTVDFPDTIAAGMFPTDIFITVNDNDGLADILWVLIQGYEEAGSQPIFQDTLWNPANNSPVFTASIDSSFAARRKGDIRLHFLAEDRAGDFSEPVTRDVYMENTPPVLLTIRVPDTILIPSSGMNVDTVRAWVTDQQSLMDIQSVYFISQLRLPDGSLGAPSDPVYLLDDGSQTGSGDILAGDGWYSRIIRIESGNTPGTYLFMFTAVDYVDQESNVLVDSVQVFKP
jgi:hypothetical protein